MRPRRVHPERMPLMALAMVILVAAVWGGLVRLGWPIASIGAGGTAFHGPLMVSGFLGTVIGLERAIAAGRTWAYAAPVTTALGALALIAGLPSSTGIVLTTLGAAGVVAVFIGLLRRQPALFTIVMALGAVVWLSAQLLWLAGWPIYRVVPWWAAFLVMTIAGERLEIARLMRPSRMGRVAFVIAMGLVIVGLVAGTVAASAGARVVGAGFLALAVWLALNDIARRTVRLTGLTRFIAVALLAGYVWLGTSGVLALCAGDVAAGPVYDAMLHSLLVGFVFSMIFGHAPIIFPAVIGLPVAYRPAFYLHLGVLHAALALRVIGDLTSWMPGRQWGGLLNAVALGLFLANTAYGVLRPIAGPDRR